jgi:hypothetical protein
VGLLSCPKAGEKVADCWVLAMLAPLWDEPKRGVAGVRRAFFALARAFVSGIVAGFDSLSEDGSSISAKIPSRRFARQRMNSNVKVGRLMATATIFVLDSVVFLVMSPHQANFLTML